MFKAQDFSAECVIFFETLSIISFFNRHNQLRFQLCFSLSTDGKRILSDLLSSPGFSPDFFSVGEDNGSVADQRAEELVRIVCLDIGAYRPQDMKWCVEGEHVLLQGKRTASVDRGVEGAKFSRAIPIPEGVDPKKITTRYNSLSGQYIVEGAKLREKRPRRKTSSAFYDESRMTLTVDLGSTMEQELVYPAASKCLNGASDSAKVEI